MGCRRGQGKSSARMQNAGRSRVPPKQSSRLEARRSHQIVRESPVSRGESGHGWECGLQAAQHPRVKGSHGAEGNSTAVSCPLRGLHPAAAAESVHCWEGDLGGHLPHLL